MNRATPVFCFGLFRDDVSGSLFLALGMCGTAVMVCIWPLPWISLWATDNHGIAKRVM